MKWFSGLPPEQPEAGKDEKKVRICQTCPHHEVVAGVRYCDKNQTRIPAGVRLPMWCPLPQEKEE